MTPTQTALLDRVAKAMGYLHWRIGEQFAIESTCVGGPDGIVLAWTRDCAAKCLPPGWKWQRHNDDFTSTYKWHAFGPDGTDLYVCVHDTRDEVSDRLTLAALAWEAKNPLAAQPQKVS